MEGSADLVTAVRVCMYVSICCHCQKWVHRKCCIKGSMYKVMKTFLCRDCVNPVTGTGYTSVDIVCVCVCVRVCMCACVW